MFPIVQFIYFVQLDDLPDFLSGEEQRNTVHIQICFKRPVCTKDKKILSKKSFLKKSPKERSDYHGRHPNSPLALSPGQSSPVLGGRSPQLHPHVGVSRTASHRSPPGQEFLTLSDLAITHHHHTARSPGQARKAKVLEYDEESPLKERSSSLQEIQVRKRKVEYSPSTKLDPESPPSSEGTWVKSASMRQLSRNSLLSVTGYLSSEDRTVSQPNLCSDGTPTSSCKLGHCNRAASSESLHIGSSTSLSMDGNNSGVEISVLDIHILKQVTDFYYYLKALWNNVKIVSPKTQYVPKYLIFHPQNQILQNDFDSPSLQTKSSPKP